VGHLNLLSIGSKAAQRVESETPRKQQHENDNHQNTENADAAMAESIAIAAKTLAKATEKKNYEYDEKNGADCHSKVPLNDNYCARYYAGLGIHVLTDCE
jgi:hypothetical protein